MMKVIEMATRDAEREDGLERSRGDATDCRISQYPRHSHYSVSVVVHSQYTAGLHAIPLFIRPKS